MLPLFYNKPIPSEVVLQHMTDNVACSRCKPTHDQQKLVGTLSAHEILLYTPLLKITAMH